MPGKFLIDVTDPRFLIGPNEDVVRLRRWCRRAFHEASANEPST